MALAGGKTRPLALPAQALARVVPWNLILAPLLLARRSSRLHSWPARLQRVLLRRPNDAFNNLRRPRVQQLAYESGLLHYYFRAVDRVYTPGGPGHKESMCQIKKLFREMGYTSMSFSDFLKARMRGSALGHPGAASPPPCRARDIELDSHRFCGSDTGQTGARVL